jgi:hypothetical protein
LYIPDNKQEPYQNYRLNQLKKNFTEWVSIEKKIMLKEVAITLTTQAKVRFRPEKS